MNNAKLVMKSWRKYVRTLNEQYEDVRGRASAAFDELDEQPPPRKAAPQQPAPAPAQAQPAAAKPAPAPAQAAKPAPAPAPAQPAVSSAQKAQPAAAQPAAQPAQAQPAPAPAQAKRETGITSADIANAKPGNPEIQVDGLNVTVTVKSTDPQHSDAVGTARRTAASFGGLGQIRQSAITAAQQDLAAKVKQKMQGQQPQSVKESLIRYLTEQVTNIAAKNAVPTPQAKQKADRAAKAKATFDSLDDQFMADYPKKPAVPTQQAKQKPAVPTQPLKGKANAEFYRGLAASQKTPTQQSKEKADKQAKQKDLDRVFADLDRQFRES